MHRVEGTRRAAAAKVRKENLRARTLSRLDRPGLTTEAIDAQEYAAMQRMELGLSTKASVQQWDAARREGLSDSLEYARAKSAEVHAIRRNAAAERAKMIAKKREEARMLRSLHLQRESEARCLIEARVGFSKACAQQAYDHVFVAPEMARQVAASEWARLGADAEGALISRASGEPSKRM